MLDTVKQFLWPIRRGEHKKFMPMMLMIAFIIFNCLSGASNLTECYRVVIGTFGEYKLYDPVFGDDHHTHRADDQNII